jgi:hypothetical protein
MKEMKKTKLTENDQKMVEMIRRARNIMEELGMAEYQTDLVQIALALFNKEVKQ